MEVYTVTLKVRYEANTLLGIFSTIEKASDYAAKQDKRYVDMSDAYIELGTVTLDEERN